jgi:DNA-binding transcriptional regulator PaaX
LGERRRRPWKGGFLAVSLPPRNDRTARRRSQAALRRLGFVESLSSLQVRPDNLRQTRSKTVEQLTDLGLESAAVVFAAGDFDAQFVKRELATLWPVRELEQNYRRYLKDLRASLERVSEMEQQDALLQLSSLGGGAMRLLASDPLLPQEMMPSTSREELTALTTRYQSVASDHWHRFMHPPQLQVIEGGRNG